MNASHAWCTTPSSPSGSSTRIHAATRPTPTAGAASVAGSTHRAEISIDKLYDQGTAFGCQGLIELRAFETPPHPRMATAQVLLVRALVAAFTAT